MVPKPDSMQQQIATLIRDGVERDSTIQRVEQTVSGVLVVVQKHDDQIDHVVTYTEVLAEGAKNANALIAMLQQQIQRLDDKVTASTQQNVTDHAIMARDIGNIRAEMLNAVNAAVTDARKSETTLQKEAQQLASQGQQNMLGVYKTATGASLNVIYILVGVLISAGGYILAHLIK